jgi:2-methylcitrate dehydratase PrpD
MAPQTAAENLASYAASLRYGDIPDDVRRRARDCVIDTVAACVFGHRAPAGRIVARHVADRSTGACHVLGSGGAPVQAEDAALANGTLAHALELDSLRKPGAGVHPGAVLLSAGLAVAQEHGLGGEALLAAIVAGCEVLLGGGLLQFAAQGEGGMVKRLHLGHAAASGIAAAKLARDGFTGPSGVLEGKMGFLHAYSAESDPAALTADLGESYETLKICFKRYPCHITAHAPVQSVADLRAEHGFAGRDVAEVVVDGSKKMAELHANQSPADNVAAQYSIAFCVAAALLHDPKQPETFTGRALADQAVLDLCRCVRVTGEGSFASSWTTRTTVKLHDGRTFSRTLDDVPGMPGLPFDSDQLRAKFLSLTTALGDRAPGLLARLERIETEPHLDWLDARPTGNANGIA